MRLLEKILVPIISNDTSNSHLETAVNLANKFNSKLLLIQILPDDAKRPSIRNLMNKHLENVFSEIINKYDLTEIEIEKIILYGNMFDKIITTSEDENVNLILIPNDIEHANSKYNIDVLTEKLIRKSQKPVWVVKEGGLGFPQKIICTVDYSDASVRALNNAIKITSAFNASLHIVNVFEPIENKYSLRYEADYNLENQKNEQENETKFIDFLKSFNFTDINYQSHILKGMADKEIIRFIEQNQLNLLFMGATGKTFIQRIMLGSVTEKVIRELPCSLVITKSENILNLKIDADISEIEKHLENARKLEETGYYKEAIAQLKICLQINDLHLPTLSKLAKLYSKIGQDETAQMYHQKIDEILKRLWNKKIELEIRQSFKL